MQSQRSLAAGCWLAPWLPSWHTSLPDEGLKGRHTRRVDTSSDEQRLLALSASIPFPAKACLNVRPRLAATTAGGNRYTATAIRPPSPLKRAKPAIPELMTAAAGVSLIVAQASPKPRHMVSV